MDRRTASEQIDDIRDALSHEDRNRLGDIVGSLWDGYPIAEVKQGLRYLSLSDRQAQRRIADIVNATEEDGGVCGGYEGDGWRSPDCWAGCDH